jgi:hypothetical protein
MNLAGELLQQHRDWIDNVAGVERADFTGCNFNAVHYADYKKASLYKAIGLIDCGCPDGYRFVAIRHKDRLMIRAGCRWFTVREARRHWAKRRDRRATRAALEYAVEVARARGWKIGR